MYKPPSLYSIRGKGMVSEPAIPMEGSGGMTVRSFGRLLRKIILPVLELAYQLDDQTSCLKDQGSQLQFLALILHLRSYPITSVDFIGCIRSGTITSWQHSDTVRADYDGPVICTLYCVKWGQQMDDHKDLKKGMCGALGPHGV